MADDTPVDLDTPALPDLAAAIVAEQLRPENLEKLRKHEQNVSVEKGKDIFELAFGSMGWLVGRVATLILNAINAPEPVYNELASAAVGTLLGEGAQHTSLPADSGRRLISKIEGADRPMAPGVDGAANYLTLMLNEQMEAWVRGVMVELITEYAPKIQGVGGGVETFARLEEIVEGALGGQRMVRRVLQPFVNATAITPSQWHVNKKYRPELLGAAATIEARLADRYTEPQMREELARQGWSDERITVMVENARKRLSIEQWIDLYERGGHTDTEVVAAGVQLGYDEPTVQLLMELRAAERQEVLRAAIIPDATKAYLDGVIPRSQLDGLVRQAAHSYNEATTILDTIDARAALRVQFLSSGDERRLALKGIRTASDFRRALEREGLVPDAIAALDLELRQEIDDKRSIAQHRAEQDAERAAEQQRAAADKAQREAELAARKALPTLTEYRRAYVRGFIPRDVFTAALTREKVAITGDDLDVLLVDADADRASFLADEERQLAAAAKVPPSRISIAQREAAVLEGISTIGEFDAQLAKADVDADDRRFFVAMLQAKLDDRDAADQARRDAAGRAELAQVSLPAFERAVRLGVRSRGDYAAWLATIATPEVAQALILDTLDAQRAVDAEARATRDARAGDATKAGIPLAQRRRAYIAGVRDRTYYEDALIAAGWPVDDRLVELELADVEAAQAEAARDRRDELDAEPPAPTLTIAQMEQAVVLGLESPATLRVFLEARGYGADDVELLVAETVARIPDVRDAQQIEQQAAAAPSNKALPLADRKALVRRGLWSLDQYAGSLEADGFVGDRAELLTRLLREEVAIDFAGLRKRIAAALAKVGDAPPLDEIVAAFVGGELDEAALFDVLRALTVDADAALVFSRLVATFGAQG